MLLFGMINWMFTWLRPDGAITHAQMAPIVSELFFGGLQAVVAQAAQPKQRERRSARVVLMNN
jgi:TetR/AcrR family transcriptional regulator